jgi:hypothetical protein
MASRILLHARRQTGTRPHEAQQDRPNYVWVVQLRKDCMSEWEYGRSFWVGVSVIEPAERIATLSRSRVPSNRKIAACLLRQRPDLARDAVFRDRESANTAKRLLVEELRSRGHWVNGRGDAFRVYVIELDDTVGPKKGDPSLPWLYVGETAIDPVQRIDQHRIGARNARGPIFSRRANAHFVRGRPDLYEEISLVHSRSASKALERKTATTLRQLGYSVISN